jgi:hypothetical protein
MALFHLKNINSNWQMQWNLLFRQSILRLNAGIATLRGWSDCRGIGWGRWTNTWWLKRTKIFVNDIILLHFQANAPIRLSHRHNPPHQKCPVFVEHIGKYADPCEW